MLRKSLPGRSLATILCLFGVVGCGGKWYRQSADSEVYGIIGHQEVRSGEAFPASRDFHVEQAPLPLENVSTAGTTEDLSRAPTPKPLAPVPDEPIEDGASSPDPAASENEPAAPASGQTPVDAAPPGDFGTADDVDAGGAQDPASSIPPAGAGGDSGAAASGAASGGQDNEAADPDGTGSADETAAVDELSTIPDAPRLAVRVLTIKDAVRLALANNRDYQSSRESVYLTALTLTLARHDFAPRFLGIVTGDWGRDASGEESGAIGSNFGLNWLFATGARLSINALNDFSRFFTGERREVASTILQAALSQPLLRGFGQGVVTEPLVQAERDVVYQLRSFERFRQTFAVRVISEYYRVLEVRDRAVNEYNNWRRRIDGRQFSEALGEAGALERIEVDQARQEELQAQDRYVGAVQSYEGALDNFKITLGIPVDEPIALDPREFQTLVERGVEPPETSVADATRAAFQLRVDLRTQRNQVEDAERQVAVREDALRMQLDVDASASLASGAGDRQQPLRFNADNLAYSVGFTLDLPLDRKAERNAYVGAIIGLQRRQRDLSLFEDDIRLTVREAHRALERETVSYPIQQASVDLAEDRVASTNLSRQAGLASTRDVLESQSALITAQNELTRSLVSYTIARLEFFRDIGALAVEDDGTVIEMNIGDVLNE